MNLFYNTIYHWIVKNDPDKPIARGRAATLLAVGQTCNFISILHMADIWSFVGDNSSIQLGIVGVLFIAINLFFLKETKSTPSKKDHVITIAYLLVSCILMTLILFFRR